jgi:hypothetical protein
MKQRSMTLRIVVLLLSFGLVAGYVAYRVWTGGQRANAAEVPTLSGGASADGAAPTSEASLPPAESHFVGSKSARVFEPPLQPIPPEAQKAEGEDLGPVGERP